MLGIICNTRKPDVSFYHNGKIDICARVVKLLDLHNGDVIDVATDGIEYYLFCRIRSKDAVGKHEATCRPTKNIGKCNNLRAYSHKLCKAMLKASNAEYYAKMPAGDVVVIEDGIKAVPLITKGATVKR